MGNPMLVHPDQVEAAVTTIQTSIHSADDVLNSLKGKIDQFLSPTGGLYLPQSSPALTDEFTSARLQIGKAIESLSSFGKMFQNIVQELHSIDGNIATSMRSQGK
jgi:hypothetical protein